MTRRLLTLISALWLVAGPGCAARHATSDFSTVPSSSRSDADHELIVAAYRGDLGAAERALKAGADPNHRLGRVIVDWPFDSDRWSALHAAAYSGQANVAALLLRHGADLRLTEGFGRTPLLLAVESCADEGRAPETALLLLKHGSDVNVRTKPMLDTRGGDTPLHLAVRANSLPLVNALIDAGARISARNDSGLTPLDVANQFGANYELVELLKKSGAEASRFDARPPAFWQTDKAVGGSGTIH